MTSPLLAPLSFGLLAAFITTVGLIIVATRSDWSARYADLFGLAAGGMLISLSLLHIAPEAFALSPHASKFMLAGFLGGLIINSGIGALFPEKMNGTRGAAVTPLIAIALHSLIDGVIYSVTFAASFSSGVYAAGALILHEFPEGVIAFAILRRHGFTNRQSFFWAFVASAATTPFGVLISAPVMFTLDTVTIGSLFAVSAGLLIYVATGPLLEPLRTEPSKRSFMALIIGVLAAIGLSNMPVHGHLEDEPGVHKAAAPHNHSAHPD